MILQGPLKGAEQAASDLVRVGKETAHAWADGQRVEFDEGRTKPLLQAAQNLASALRVAQAAYRDAERILS